MMMENTIRRRVVRKGVFGDFFFPVYLTKGMNVEMVKKKSEKCNLVLRERERDQVVKDEVVDFECTKERRNEC